MNPCPDFSEIPEYSQADYDNMIGGFIDTPAREFNVSCTLSPAAIAAGMEVIETPPHAHKPTTPPAQNAVYRLDAFDVLARASSEISALAEQAGIDWHKLSSLINSSQQSYTRGIELDKSFKGKVKAWLEFKRTKSGLEFVTITFNCFKTGGIKSYFDGFKWLKNNGYLDNTTPPPPKPPTANSIERDRQRATNSENQKIRVKSEFSQKLKRFDTFKNLFESLPALTAENFQGSYLQQKGFSFEQIPNGLFKAGLDKNGSFVVYQLTDKAFKTSGYQKLYSARVEWLNGNKENIFFPILDEKTLNIKTLKNGSFALIGNAATVKDTVYLCEGIATGLSINIATGKPVLVAMDAGNLLNVAKASPFKNLVFCADNDVTDNAGNVGIYHALKSAKTRDAKTTYPVLATGNKCDFNDLHTKHGLTELTAQLKTNVLQYERQGDYYKALLEYVPVTLKCDIEKIIKCACFFAVSELLVNHQDNVFRVAEPIQAIINQRRFTDDKGYIFDAISYCRWFFAKRQHAIKQANSLTDNAGLSVHNFTTGTANTVILAEMRNHKKALWIDTRPMGAGKTELMKLIADSAKQTARAKNTDTQSTYIAHRVALIKDAASRLNLRFYEDVAWWQNERPQTLAVCANSIVNHKVASHAKILFIDEIRQVLEHVLNGTVENRLQVFNELEAAIKNADFVLCADADMNDFTLNWLKSISNKPIHLIEQPTVKNDKSIIELNTNAALFSQIRADLKAGKNVWITTDSMSKAKSLNEFLSLDDDSELGRELTALLHDTGLSLKDDDVLLVTSENKADIRQALFLANPNEESKKYRVVIHTPVISSGVSVTNGHFENIYGIFCNVTAPNEMLQSIGRVRTAKKIYATFKTGHVKSRATNLKDLIDGEAIKRSRFSQNRLELDNFDVLRLKSIVNKNTALNEFKPYFFLLADQKGYSVKPYALENNDSELTQKLTLELEENLKKPLKNISKVVKTKTVNDILNAPVIEDKTANQHRRANALTQVQSDALKRYDTALLTGKDNNTDDLNAVDVDFFLNDGASIMANYELLQTSLDDVKQKDNDNYVFRDKLPSKTSKKLHFETVINGINALTTPAGKGIFNAEIAENICKYLADNHQELTANRLGNFKKTSKQPIKQLGQFLSRCGYDLTLHHRDPITSERFYSIAENNQVKSYAAARLYQRKLKTENELE